MNALALPLALLLSYAAGQPPESPIQLNGYFACTQRMLIPSAYAFVCYAPAQQNCQSGKVILAYEKRVSSPIEKTRFAIIDTVQLNLRSPNNSLSISSCTNTKGKTSQYFVLCTQDNLGSKYLRHVLRVWGVDTRGHLVEVPAKTLKCLNDDFGA